MALAGDIKITRYGTPDGHEPLNLPLGANVQVYRGSIALLASTGYLKNAASPASTDTCVGLIEKVGPGQIDSGPGIKGGSTDGAVTCDVAEGTFFLGSSTGGDQLGVSTIGKTVYVYNENTVAATSNGNTRPVAGVHVATDSTGRYPGGYAIKMGPNQTIGGGV